METKETNKQILKENYKELDYDIEEFAEYILNLKLWTMQAKMLKEFYESGKQELVLVLGKKSGKDFMAAVIGLYEVYKLLLLDNPQEYFGFLKGQKIYVLNTATGKSQAVDILLDYAKKMVQQSDFLKMFIKESFLAEEIRFEKSIFFRAQSSSSRASLGYTCVVTIFDELAWFIDTNGNASGKAVYDALKPNLKPFKEYGKSIVISSPSGDRGILHSLYNRALKDPNMMCFNLATWKVNPNMPFESFKSDFDKDPLKARLDFGAEFVGSVGAALNSEKIKDSLQDIFLNINIREKRRRRVIALDPGLKHDRYALVMGYQKGEISIVDYAHTWQGTPKNPVNIEEVEQHIKQLCKNFNIIEILLDQHQSASTIQRLKREGKPVEETFFTGKYNRQIFFNLNERINLNKVILCNHELLINELRALQRNGIGDMAKFEAPKSGLVTTDDLADACANCIYHLCKLVDIGTDDFAIDDMESTQMKFSKKDMKAQEDDFALF